MTKFIEQYDLMTGQIQRIEFENPMENQIQDSEETIENPDMVPNGLINIYVEAFRNLLKGESLNNNLYRFIFENSTTKNLEKSKMYLPRLSVIGLIACQQVINKYYEVHNTWEGPWETTESASEIDVTIAFNKSMLCFENGIIELSNMKTGKRVTINMDTECNKPNIIAYSEKNTGEAKNFIKLVEKLVKVQNIYKNKVLTLKQSFHGMIPKFLEPVSEEQSLVVLPKDIHQIIQSNVVDMFERSKEYKEANIPLKRGVLLEGPPGTGKTSLIKYLERKLSGQVTFLYVTDGIISSANDIATVYEFARQYAPSIVVLEDIDTIGLQRAPGGSNFTSELLGQLDGLEALEGVVTIATTNYPELIDDALKNRPSRFDRRIQISLPAPETRQQILKEFLKNAHIDSENIDLEQLTRLTNKFSGAMIKEVIITAKMEQIQNKKDGIDNDSLKEAVNIIKATFHDSEISSSATKVGFRSK